MEPIVSMLQETGQHVAKQQTAFVVRTRDAGAAFVDETRDAGRDFVHFVQTEAKRWKRYVRARVTSIESEARKAREALTPTHLEKRVLSSVDDTLKALDARVRLRLAALERQTAKKPARRRAPARKKPAAGRAIALAA